MPNRRIARLAGAGTRCCAFIKAHLCRRRLPHLTPICRSCRCRRRPLGVVHVVVAGQPPEYRLSQASASLSPPVVVRASTSSSSRYGSNPAPEVITEPRNPSIRAVGTHRQEPTTPLGRVAVPRPGDALGGRRQGANGSGCLDQPDGPLRDRVAGST